jgi:hypothetical protein
MNDPIPGKSQSQRQFCFSLFLVGIAAYQDKQPSLA